MKNPAELKDLEGIFANVIKMATYFALLIAFVILVLGGFRYITSGGDPKKAEEAKNIITYAIFGLLALVGIWFLLKLIAVFTGVNVTEFII